MSPHSQDCEPEVGGATPPQLYSSVFDFLPPPQARPAFQPVLLFGEPWQAAGLAEAPILKFLEPTLPSFSESQLVALEVVDPG